MAMSIAMLGGFCPACKEYVFYKMRGSDDVSYNYPGPPWCLHICENKIAGHREAALIKPIEGATILNALDYNNRGVWKAEKRRYEEAMADYNTAIRLAPTDALIYFNRGLAKAKLHHETLTDYNRAIREYGINPISISHIQAKPSAAIVSAISDFDRAIQLTPDFARAYLNRGILKVELAPEPGLSPVRYGDSMLWQVIFGFPYEYDNILRVIDNGNSRRAAYYSAISDFDTTIRLNPDDPRAYGNRALVQRKIGDKASAQKDLRTALKLAKEARDTELITWIEGLIEQR